MSIWGIAPRIGPWAFGYAAFAVAGSIIWRETTVISAIPALWARIAAGVILAPGILFYANATHPFLSGWKEGKLVTTGSYALCRHPIYAFWICFLLPAASLFFRSWLLLSTVAVFYALVRMFVPAEERALIEEFGEEYQAYKNSTPSILPIPLKKKISG